MRQTTQERFDVKYLKMADGCWHWVAQIAPNGYGRMQMGLKADLAHRVSYTLHKGPIPEDAQIDHLCRVRKCVNPDHLEAVTCQENLLRGETRAAENAAKVICVNGHDLTDSWIRSNGARQCRQCNRDAQKRHYSKVM
ncbi:hypothetical protein LCGC14_1813320 [marine sediment metagenome]|uniref:HNH nuclease domain-containing protein n=1 Tax=marine sediment metagenome TaxID=412755 RepID=A0A0F9GKW8_9ZZZZ